MAILAAGCGSGGECVRLMQGDGAVWVRHDEAQIVNLAPSGCGVTDTAVGAEIPLTPGYTVPPNYLGLQIGNGMLNVYGPGIEPGRGAPRLDEPHGVRRTHVCTAASEECSAVYVGTCRPDPSGAPVDAWAAPLEVELVLADRIGAGALAATAILRTPTCEWAWPEVRVGWL